MNKELLDLILAQLAEDFPDTAKTYSAEVFADWLANLSKQYMEAFNTPQRNSTITAEFRRGGLSPTGRRPSQPELQHLPPLKQAVQRFDQMTPERAKELLQQYRDTFPAMGAPWEASLRNFPCVAVDLASGVDYSVEQHPIQADHASVDDKGNVTWHGIRRGVFSSKGHPQNLPKYNPPRLVGANPLLGAPYGKSRYDKDTMTGPTFRATLEEVRQQTWGNMTPDDIYKDIAEAMKKMRTPVEQLIQHRLTRNWTISHGTTTISYAPNSAVDIPVLVASELLDNGVVEVVESCQGEAAVKRARYYLECFEARMKR